MEVEDPVEPSEGRPDPGVPEKEESEEVVGSVAVAGCDDAVAAAAAASDHQFLGPDSSASQRQNPGGGRPS